MFVWMSFTLLASLAVPISHKALVMTLTDHGPLEGCLASLVLRFVGATLRWAQCCLDQLVVAADFEMCR